MALNFAKRVIIFILSGLGIIRNIFVFMNYMCFIRDTKKKFMHLILIHLVFTNIILLLSKGIPTTIATFGLRNFLDDNTGCKIVVYLERISRGLSICTSALLTVVQASTISPRHSRWRRLEPRTVWHVLPLLLSFWGLNSMVSINLLYIVTSTYRNSSHSSENDNYCDFLPQSPKINWIFLSLLALRDTVFQGIMGGASGYMVFLLHKHHQRVLHLQSSRFVYKTPPEIKAAQSVLLLMLCFLTFYWADCVTSLYLHFFSKTDSVTINLQEFLTIGYAVLSPFVLIHRDGTWLNAGMLWQVER
ncbi:LOW QUALITY PROTEIN: vomeronasal type-1 receptor 3-like [Fukomys damarensis]|uniref:LOW QUALITY PROTEIN: vomeronasal type-1 receptor 3-like n=1 Tax=Fukomys damarensis TaxID=885580 RepID=UPI0008FEC284|nr:LOW QUALITY PROTEIN: vomeronasal type-1 receptor 3-like [Fukomys damarensis]